MPRAPSRCSRGASGRRQGDWPLLLGAACVLGVSLVACAAPESAAASAALERPETRTASPSPVARPLPSRSPSPAPALRASPKVVQPSPPARPVDPWARFGFDISWPQCRGAGAELPPAVGTFALVGVTGGRPLTTNPCLQAEWRWASGRARRGVYVNLSSPADATSPAAFGAATVRQALASAAALGVRPTGTWMDVEVGNHWSDDPQANLAVVTGALAAAREAGVQPGVYSSLLDWKQITGDAPLDVPTWKAVPDGRRLGAGCTEPGFGGRPADLVQAVFLASGKEVDGDLQCTRAPGLAALLESHEGRP